MRYLLLIPFFLPTFAWAECPQKPDTGDARAALYTELLKADSEERATEIASALWRIWLTAPDEQAQDLLDRGMERREAWDFLTSESLFDRLIAYCPHYIEAYNQRAFSRFLRSDFDGTLEDIAVVLSHDPYHFGALSGQAMTFMRQGRVELAQEVLRKAVKVHPYLRERQLLVDEPDEKI